MRILIFSLLCSLISSGCIAEVKLQRVGSTLFQPWGMSLLNDTEALVTERRGKLFRINLSTGERREISNLPKAFTERQGGLLDILVHNPDTPKPDIYFCYSRHTPNGAATAVNRAVLDGDTLVRQDVIFTANNSSWESIHFGCRLAIVNRHLFVSLGDRGQRHSAQDGLSHGGSVVRIKLNRTIPDDNHSKENWLPELLTKGHRNPQGMAVHPKTDDIWVNEHGPKGGDEINILQPGENYGWPLLSFGQEYSGGQVGGGETSKKGYVDSVWHWTPSIAPSGMAFYEGGMFPEFAGKLLVSSLKFRSIYLVDIDNGKPIKETAILKNEIGRIRDIEIAADGSILILTDEDRGGIYRLYR